MDNNLDEQLLVMRSSVDINKQHTANIEKTLNINDSESTNTKKFLKQRMVQNQHYSPDNI